MKRVQQNSRIYLIVFCVIVVTSCKTVDVNVREPVQFLSKEKLISETKKIYFPYKKLYVYFILKGESKKTEFSYIGSIISSRIYPSQENAYKITVNVQEPILKSSIFSLSAQTGKKISILKDHLEGKEYKLSHQHKFDILGHQIPKHFFLSIIQGFIPDFIFKKGGKYLQKSQKFIVDMSSHDVIADFQDGELRRYLLRNKKTKKILVCQIIEYFDFQKRIFPKFVIIKDDQSNDYLEIKFQNLKLTL